MSLPVDKALRKAQSHIKAGELAEAEELYKQVLSKFPKNKKAIQEYQKLKVGLTSKGLASSEPPKEKVKELMSLYSHGQFDEVLSKAKPLIRLFPKIIVLHNLIAAANSGLKNFDQAIESFHNVLALNPKDAMAYFNVGTIFLEKKEFDEAIVNYHKCLAINPNHAEAYDNMGTALKAQGNLTAAVGQFTQAINLKSNFAQAYYNLGVALQEQENFSESIKSYEKACQIKPNYFKAYLGIGNTLKEQGKVGAAIDSYEQAIKIKPDYAEAYNNMGLALQDMGELDAAIDSCEQAIKIKPSYAEAYSNMGLALQDKGELDTAMDSYEQAIKIKPDFAEAYSNMGNALQGKGKLDAAIESYKQALKIKPDFAEAHHNLGFVLLNTGRLKEGLDEHEWRWESQRFSAQRRHFTQPLWDGNASLKGQRILIWGEQGPGDVVMWSSCLPFVALQAEKCILECQEKLVPLLTRSFPNVEVKVENKSLDTKRDDFDFHLPIGSLFRHFIPEISKETKPDAFLIPDLSRVNFWKERLNLLGKGPFVGISWKSPFMTPARLPNYTQISDWAPVLTLPNVTFINLQCSDFGDDLASILDEFGVTVHNFDDLDHYNDLDDVAALSAALDIAVSVSTAVSTIAAGVGTPTKMLHWRQSSWNNILLTPPGPFVDVFERNTWEPWDNVFHSVAKDIADFQDA